MTAFYLRFGSEQAFNEWHAAVNAALGFPKPETRTECYTYCVPGSDGNWHAPADEHCPEDLLSGLDLLTPQEAHALIYA